MAGDRQNLRRTRIPKSIHDSSNKKKEYEKSAIEDI